MGRDHGSEFRVTECLIETGEPCESCQNDAESNRLMAGAIGMVLSNTPGSGLHEIGKARWKNLKRPCTGE